MTTGITDSPGTLALPDTKRRPEDVRCNES